ncbi:hypothetical protein BJX70DRAFT_251167 [Aspergillus crustosus]
MNPPSLDGWQFNDNSRSSWDIVWTCLTTIFACTWTVLHLPVAARNVPEGRITAAKLWIWTIAFLAPELLALEAAEEFWRVWSLKTRCNQAQAAVDASTGEPESWLYHRTKSLLQAQGVDDLDLYPVHARWTFSQCFCVEMGGLTFETSDGWIFYVRRDQLIQFIEAGLIKCTDFTDREIKDRAKSDAFAKAFTVCQSTWVTANIIARAAYDLPITPFEFSTISYVVCAIMVYACWWSKPQDMAVPITIPLRYTRSDLPEDICIITDCRPKRWKHRQVIPPKDGVFAGLRTLGRRYQTMVVDETVQGTMTRGYRELSLRDETWLNTVAALSGLIFCGVHVAAWNFAFPTHAERIAWRVLSLTALAMVFVVYAIGQVPLIIRWLLEHRASLPQCLQRFADPNGKYTLVEIFLPFPLMLIYAIARLGLVALTLSSLRALPSGAYIAVDWLGSIPHI